MVYESDFYTTRRPYSRPLVSSYTVTGPSSVMPLSTIIQLRNGHPRMPYIAHKRLVTVIHTPVRTVYHHGTLIPIRIHARVRPSVLAAELNRIRDLPRPSTESYIEKFLNSRDCIYFDDEAREIRARVDSLLRRIHIFVPRASPSDFAEEIVPERMRNDNYIRRLISGKSNMKKEPEAVSWYDVPERGNFGNLACVKFVAGKPQSVRRPYYKVADLRPSDIKNDVNFLSYYKKNLQAAENAFPDHPMTERELRKARALETEWSKPAKKIERETIQEAEGETEPAGQPEILSQPDAVQQNGLQNGHLEEQLEEEPELVVSEKKEKKKEKKQKEKDVKHEREEALKRAEAFLIKQTAAARMAEEKRYFEEMRRLAKERAEADARAAEERQRALDEERAKLELEEQKAWIAMKETQEARARIAERHENERLEALRKAEVEKEEQDRIESIRIAQAEKEAAAAAAAVAAEEQERLAMEEAVEEVRKQQEAEERLAEIATVGGIDDSKEYDRSVEEPLTIEETYQEREERPCEIITDDETHIEEENVPEEHEIEEIPFVEEVDDSREAGDKQPEESPIVEESPVVEEAIAVAQESAPTGGEEAMWDDVVAEETTIAAEHQEETAPIEKEEVEAAIFDGADEETVVVDGSDLQDVQEVPAVSGGEEEAPGDAVEETEVPVVEEAQETEESAAVVEDVISPSDGIEETFEWGDEDA